LHCLTDQGGYAEPSSLYGHRNAAEVVRSYLAEVAVLVASDQPFDVLAHIDYPVRSWPIRAGVFQPADFEDEFRHALRPTAESDRALEVNTVVPLHARILQWWHDEGGSTVTFASDAHDPEWIARGFGDAVQLAEAHGFRPGRDPFGFWTRVD
jgi:histidinol-phosphatase (PHP family)